jgi:hypothetical protein
VVADKSREFAERLVPTCKIVLTTATYNNNIPEDELSSGKGSKEYNVEYVLQLRNPSAFKDRYRYHEDLTGTAIVIVKKV